LTSSDFLIGIYNNLSIKSGYRSDLVDLFGTPDGFQKGYLGSLRKPLTWDWGTTGFRKIINIMHSLSGQDPNAFKKFYRSEIMHNENIIQRLIIKNIINENPQMLYIFKYSTKRIPAFTAKINEISWIDGRIWITYEPKRYMLIDPATWKEFREQLLTKGREDPKKWYDTWDKSWNSTRPSLLQLERMLQSSASQDQYHLIPRRFLMENIKRKSNPFSKKRGTFFTKDITKVTKRLKLRVPTDNQAFWGILSEFTSKTQVRGNVELEYKHAKYTITDIPANTISEDSLVFKQEIGAARTICQAMLDVFGRDYLDLEFPRGTVKKNILDSKFLKRAVKVFMVAKVYDKKFGETDFDYQLDLTPLLSKYPNLNKKILFDLTAGLWNKSSWKTNEEFLEQWAHNLVKLPERNNDLCVLWHYGLLSKVKDGSYKGQEVGDYLLSKTASNAIKYQRDSIKKASFLPRIIFLPFFRDSKNRLETELNRISSVQAKTRRNSELYTALKELLERLS
jgi:hypothetical protein